MKELVLSLALWALLISLPFLSGLAGAVVAALWIGGGIHMVCQSRSRGFLADASFIVTWPIYVAIEGWK